MHPKPEEESSLQPTEADAAQEENAPMVVDTNLIQLDT